jgi:hypothetical protein
LSTGLEGFNDAVGGGAQLPKRQLVQGMSVVKGMPDARKGFFVDEKAAREIGKSMDVVVLKIDTQRVLFYDKTEVRPTGKDGRPVKGPKCASDDGIVPSPRVAKPQNSVCSDCAYNKKDLVYRLVCYDVKDSNAEEQPVLFTIDAKSTQLKAVRDFVKAVRDRNKATRDFKVTMTAQVKENEKGQWYVLGFEQIEPTPSNIRQDVDSSYELVTGGGEPTEEVPPPTDDDIPF